MKKLILLLAVITSCAFGQGVRYDSYNVTSAKNVPVGAQANVMTLPYSTVTVCVFDNDLTTPCSSTSSIYSDEALTLVISQPLQSDSQGRFGFWIAAGIYKYSIKTATGTQVGTFALSLNSPQGPQGPGGIGCGAANCIIAAPAATQTISQPAGTFTKNNAFSADGNFITTNSGAQTIRAWGNSQTAGYGAGPDCPIGNLTCTSVFAWPSIFAQKMGWTVDNQAVSSSDCADLTYQGQNKSMWDVTYPILDNTRTIYGHFRNDQSQYGPLPYRVDFARGCIEAQMAWLAIPEVSTTTGNPSKFRATSGLVSKTGTWTSIGEPNTASMSTTQAGATMTFQVRGTTAYIATSRKHTTDGSFATYSITLDGQPVEEPTLQSGTFSQAMDVGSAGGFPVSQAIIPYLIRMPGLSNGTHIVQYTCINPSTDSCRVFFGAGVQTDNSTANGPIVYSLSPVNNADAQATGNFTFAVTQLYLDEWHRIVSELSADGLQIIGLDATNLNVYWADAQNIGDGVHPNTSGQNSLGLAMAAKATLASTPQDRVEAKATNTSTGYGGFGAGPAPSPSGGGSTNPSYHIPTGSLWSSHDAQTGCVYMGFDGSAYLCRIANDNTNTLGFGTGRTLTFNSPSGGVNDNFAIPGQFTSFITSTGNGGTYKFTNGSNSSFWTQAGSAPSVPEWANHAVLVGAGAGIVYDAAVAGAEHRWEINSGTVMSLTPTSLNTTVPILSPSITTGTTSTGSCTAVTSYVTLIINGSTYKLAACP